MRKISKTLWLFLVFVAFLGNHKSYGQIEEIGNMMAAGKDDARLLIQPYISPAVNAFGASLSGGWYNTAKTHKLGGFDLSITATASFIPQKDKSFLIENDQLQFLKLENTLLNDAPSIAGEKENGPQLVYNIMDEDDNVVYTQQAFTMPKGLNLKLVPAPMVQVGIGLIKGTDIMFRFCPDLKYDGNEIGLWGIGGKHDLKQWIPGLKNIPVFQMSIMYGYTKLHAFVNMDINKNTIGASGLSGNGTFEDQKMELFVRSKTANLLFAADLKVVCFYGGIGFVTTKTNLKLKGEFPVVTVPAGETVAVVETVKDPLNMTIKNQDGGITKPRLNAGIRFKFAVVTVQFDYTWANYSALTAGLGLSIR
jgi:hypothetical protein